MKQVFQDLRNGAVDVRDVPSPAPCPGHLLLQTRASLISSGTERMLVEFGQASWLAKARSQPDKVRQVLDKIRTDGLLPTLEVVLGRLEEPLPLGYCNAGKVVDVGAGVEGFHIGDRVASNAPHAEFVSVPANLCARVPDGVEDDEAAFTVIGAVALQGVRLLAPTLGEAVAVMGLGLVGQMAVQILRANGCRVLGIDPNPVRRELARACGAATVVGAGSEDPLEAGLAFSRGRGVDAVLITASSEDSGIVSLAARMSRKRGRIVLVGVVGLELRRADFYEKELTFQVSCSYGPGRYDPQYEDRSRDYPVGFVRWTAQRNFEAILDMLEGRRLCVGSLVSKRIPQQEAGTAYRSLTDDPAALAILLTYDCSPVSPARIVVHERLRASIPATPVRIGVIGAGSFARAVLLPALRATGADLVTVASRQGGSATYAARKFGFRSASSDVRAILEDGGINTVFVLTRHDSHARFASEALRAGKHVFVEKPLALDSDELAMVSEAHRGARRHLMVGFNRRFAPLAGKVRAVMRTRSGPACLVMTVNAGVLPPDHWLNDPREGGGRIVGEAVHWIDLLTSLVGHRVSHVVSAPLRQEGGSRGAAESMTISLSFADGSIGTVHYFTEGSRRFPKERLEVFFGGKVLQLDNFRRLRSFGVSAVAGWRAWRQDKGHRAEVASFVDAIARGAEPIVPYEEFERATLISFAAVESARTGRVIPMENLEVHGPEVRQSPREDEEP